MPAALVAPASVALAPARSLVKALALCVGMMALGCASLPHRSLAPPPPLMIPTTATVFVADGAGNFQVASKMLRQVAQDNTCPLEVDTFEWSHGYGRMIADQLYFQDARRKGMELAAQVVAYRQAHPDRPIYLLGHSAGSTVIMAALENMPPGIVDRAILLSPSLSACYDVRPALEAVSDGLFVFYSRSDFWYLGVVTRLVGSSDRFLCPTSGRIGFHARTLRPGDAQAHKLHQRAWVPEDAQLGNNGGHYGNYQPAFMAVHVLPLLRPGAVAVDSETILPMQGSPQAR